MILTVQVNYGQIIKEGKGIDSITIGIKESKIKNILGEIYTRKNLENNGYSLAYSTKALTITFDNDSIVNEILINPSVKRKTFKGLIIKPNLKMSEVRKVYGKENWITKDGDTINNGYDSGIIFRTKLDKNNIHSNVIEIIIEQNREDYDFQDYIEGVYIPKNLSECFKELNRLLKQDDKENIKLNGEKKFMAEYHFSIGLWIRNNWGLWRGSALSKYFNSLEIYHPDDMSGIILNSYYNYLSGNDIQLQKQVEYYKMYWKVNKVPSKAIYPKNVKKIEFNSSYSYTLKENNNPGCVHLQTNSETDKIWIYDYYFGWKLIDRKEQEKLIKTSLETREETLREIFQIK